MSVVVQSLWIGPRLGVMEAAAARSHLARGHAYHLYVYDEVAGAPPGVELKDAAAVLPRSAVACYAAGPVRGSYAVFANYFRYALLVDRGNWRADADPFCPAPFCPAPFDLPAERVFPRELASPGGPGQGIPDPRHALRRPRRRTGGFARPYFPPVKRRRPRRLGSIEPCLPDCRTPRRVAMPDCFASEPRRAARIRSRRCSAAGCGAFTKGSLARP